MSRVINFKAIKALGGEWVYGSYYEANNLGIIQHLIIRYDRLKGEDVMHEIIPETLCQYTGLNDQRETSSYPEGKPIYEGDILNIGSNGVVTIENGNTYLSYKPQDPKIISKGTLLHIALRRADKPVLTIGNTHDKIDY